MKDFWYGYKSDFLAPKEADLVYFDVRKEPFGIHGIYEIQPDNFFRLPVEFAKTVSEGVTKESRAGAGVRVCFATDSPYVAIKAKLHSFCEQPHITIVAEKGFDLYTKENGEYRFHNVFYPPLDLENEVLGITKFEDLKMRNIIINFPLGSGVTDFEIGLKKGSQIIKPDGYKNEKPVVFYGSSITQGFAASRPGNIYENCISREMDLDYINLGFAGSALGEKNLAEYISKIPMSAFVLDYDHNAPGIEHLKNTHNDFYQIIRKENPSIPVIFVTRPDPSDSENTLERRKIIYNTYDNAKKKGENVYFVDGGKLFPDNLKFDCTADWCHPNDTGMYFMAQGIKKILSQIL